MFQMVYDMEHSVILTPHLVTFSDDVSHLSIACFKSGCLSYFCRYLSLYTLGIKHTLSLCLVEIFF